MKKHSKRYDENRKKVDRDRTYTVPEAVQILKSMKVGKFDETVEVALNLGIDSRHADQNVRGTLMLPRGTGRQVTVLVFAEGDNAEEARKAGADHVGSKELADKIANEKWTDFDIAITTPDMMRHVGKLGRILGPQGKMPSPKTGTLTENVRAAVEEFKRGKIEYRNDKGGVVHGIVGRASFSADDLVENIEAFLNHIKTQRPPGAKGTFIRKVFLSTTMGPGITLAVAG